VPCRWRDRHANYPTCDLPAAVLGEAGAGVARAVGARLLPQMAARFGLRLAALALQDLFVAKYSCSMPGGQVAPGSYSIVTFQYSSTTLYQVSYHIR
jgi:hypothetical protein